MEGLLQSFKERDFEKQKLICKMKGWQAKKHGLTLPDWRKDQFLYWKGYTYQREGEEYQRLLNIAYDSLFKNTLFQRALKNTIGSRLTHKIGKSDIKETILTEEEFISRLTNLRERL